MRRRIGVNAPFFKTDQTSLYRQLMVAGSNPVTSSNDKPLRIEILGGFLCIFENQRRLRLQEMFFVET